MRTTHYVRVLVMTMALALVSTLGLWPPGGGGLEQAEAQPALPWMDPSLPPAERAELLVDAMTLDQKLQQIYNEPVYNEDLDVDGDPDTDDRTRWDCDFTPVGRHIEGIPELAIPDFRQANGGTGIRGGDCVPEPTATALPAQVSSAATFNSDLAYRWGEVLDVELRSWAHHALWGPTVNLMRTPYGGRNNEYFSEDPYLSGVQGGEIIKGLQARGVSHGTIKHFVANDSEYQFERWTSANRVPPRAMHELYLLPFEMVVKDADVASVMCAYPHVNHSYTCDSSPLLQDILRDQWGFDGYIYSDRRAMQSTVPSILAGVSVELDETAEWYKPELVMAAIARGEITEEHIDVLLLDRYTVMFEYGDFEDPHTEFLWDELDPLIERGGEHAVFAKEAAAESLVLLRNNNDLLPLETDGLDSIALIGAEWFAGEATLPPRSGNREENISVVEPYQVTPQEGLEEVLADLDSDATVTFNNGDVIADAVQVAEDADVTILMIGDVARETWDKNSNWREENPGGGADGAENEVPDLDLPSVEGTNQQMLIPQILDANPNTIVVAKTQGQVNMPRLDDMHTLVQAWYPGQEDGAVVAEALFGETNFSGKLPMTIGRTDREAAYATQEQYPGQLEDTGIPGGIGRDPLCNDPDEAPPCEESGPAPQRVVRYLEDLEMGYRWYEANGVDPVFPFGFGLSYTTFEYSDLSLENSTDPDTGAAQVTVDYTVTNTGDRTGKEASQVYLTLPDEADQPSKRLVAFDKVELEPGQSERHSIVLDSSAASHPFSYFRPDHPEDLARWAEGEWVTPNGAFTVHVGGSSADTPLTESFQLEQPVQPALVQRIQGPDRYATAAQISAEFPDGVDTVYVANGTEAFEGADALAAGAAGSIGGLGYIPSATPDGDPAPILLVRQDSIPSATAGALADLAPSQVIIVGGTTSVSTGVEEQLSQSADVRRIAGEDRYETAALIAVEYGSADTVYVATGQGSRASGLALADALTAGSLAGSQNAPVVLTKTGSLPAATAEVLTELGVSNIVLVGGPVAVDDSVLAQLTAIAPTERVAGKDRYGTAVALTAGYGTDGEVLYIASGNNFPDALSGSSLTGSQQAPLLIARQDSLPGAIAEEILRLSPQGITIFGGPVAVDEDVEAELQALLDITSTD